MAHLSAFIGVRRHAALFCLAAACFAFSGALTDLAAAPVPMPKPEQPGSSERLPEPLFFKIATGSPGGTYFPIGTAIAAIVSHPIGSERCREDADVCGPLGMQAVAQNSDGSVRNILAVNDAAVASGLAQSNLVAEAVTGSGAFRMEGPQEDIRVIARLYPEAVHLVVAARSDIADPTGLKGRSISVDRDGSGTQEYAMKILRAFGLRPADLDLVELEALEAADLVYTDDLDGFFFVGGAPVPAIEQLSGIGSARVVPIAGAALDALAADSPYLEATTIPAGTYRNTEDIDTVGVHAVWIVNANVSEDRVYDITRALWNEANRDILAGSHPAAGAVTPEAAIVNLPAPLHPGAERFYRDAGLFEVPPGAGAAAETDGATLPEPVTPAAGEAEPDDMAN